MRTQQVPWTRFPFVGAAAVSIAFVLISADGAPAQRTVGDGDETVLRGVVLDAMARTFVEGASVLVEGRPGETLTDSLGAFEVVVGVGPQRLKVEQDGYDIVILSFEVEAGPRAPLEVALDPILTDQPVVRGVVLDAATRTYVEGARVFVVGRRRGTMTDSQGAFEVVASVGPQRIAVEQYGYEDAVFTITVESEPGASVEVALNPRPSLLEDTTGVRGVVRDAATRRNLEGARVSIEGSRVRALTDSRGAFEVIGEVGPQRLTVEQFGYVGVVVEVEVEAEPGAAVEVALDPEPFMLDGITVLADGLEEMERRIVRRRNAAAISVRAFELDDLMSSPAWNIDELMSFETTVRMVPCPTASNSFLCIQRRGRVVSPTVCFDEVRLFGGLDVLANYPLHQFYLVEVFGGGTLIKVYTHWFMERVARSPRALFPISFSPC